MPAQEQLDQLTKNVQNLMDLSDHLLLFMEPKVNEVYDMISADKLSDSGYEWVCSLLETVFEIAEFAGFEGAAIAGAFMPVFFSAISPQDVESDLKVKSGATWARLSKTFQDAETRLASIHDHPADHWDELFTSPVTGKTAPVSSLGDVALKIPDKYSEEFQRLTGDLTSQFRIQLARTLMADMYLIYLDKDYWMWGDKAAFFKEASGYVHDYPYTFFRYRKVWKWDGPQKKDVIQYYRFGLASSSGYEPWASKDLCEWLFQDNGYGAKTNPDGVTARSDVFFKWDLRVYFPDGEAPFGYEESTYSLTASAAAAVEQLSPDEMSGEPQGPSALGPMQPPPPRPAP